MKLLNKTKWIIIFAVLAVLAVAARPTDMLLAKFLYAPESVYGSSAFTIAPAMPFLLCSFSCAVMLSCRNTMTTRAKNRILNIIYGILTVAFAAVSAWYPFIGVENKNFIVIAAATLLISGTAFFIAFTSFRETYQKIVMTRIAKTILISSVSAAVICAVALLIPQRPSYEALLICADKYGSTDGPFESTVPVISFIGASTAPVMALCSLTDALPKLKFSGNLLFVLFSLWTLVVIFSSVASGKVYLSEAVYGALIGHICLFLSSKFPERKEKP